ncbi:MAG: TIGR00159 family protein [Candidatus Omnitrophica bacterium CG22_combo_CG10-13_8_21_14_all_43_16]|nr:MAG: TIGR00159 family protein [Candidatus Omnitrophica bacterium CG22_combo_CG10-13_8_21_14_all_43_16]
MHNHISLVKILIEICILWFVCYGILLFARGTRGVYVLRGIILITLIFIITKQLGFDRINWIFTKIFALSILAFLIIFQQEIRRGLASIGQRRWSRFFLKETEIISEITTACFLLSKKKTGALIAIERETRLENYIESGIEIDAKVNSELLITIFTPNTPLHDGGIVISGERVAASGCLFPLTQNPKVSTTLGTRHRAALGLSEETDAIVVIVSEETGGVSVAIGGRLTHDLDRESLERVLGNLYRPDSKNRK